MKLAGIASISRWYGPSSAGTSVPLAVIAYGVPTVPLGAPDRLRVQHPWAPAGAATPSAIAPMPMIRHASRVQLAFIFALPD